MDEKALIGKAIEAREKSYSPYSDFRVGAALLCADGTIYTGCNIENAAYSPANCAERTAFFKAVSEGKRNFSAIAVVGWKNGGKPCYSYPCGVCRQVMMEFCDAEQFTIIIAASESDYIVSSLSRLLPNGFGPNDLNIRKF